MTVPHRDWKFHTTVSWLIVFCAFFYTRTLPNAAGNPTRADLWSIAPGHVFNLFIDTLVPPPALKSETAHGWEYLPQRFPLWTAAGFIILGCWACGRLTLRRMGLGRTFTRCERLVLACTIGIGEVTLFMMISGCFGWMGRGWIIGLLALAVFVEAAVRWLAPVSPNEQQPPPREPLTADEIARRRMRRTVCVMSLLPFVIVIILGGATPSTDFDVKEYHLQGPKEWYQAGQITFLRHNVYTTFPFLTEMVSLLGMVVYGDWFWGALVGKSVLCWFGPLTALACYALARRWFGETAGLIAGFVYLTTPWTVRISIIAYAEGGLCLYLIATLLAVTLLQAETRPARRGVTTTELPGFSKQHIWLCGFLAGCAMACKYTGLLFVVLPMAVIVLAYVNRHSVRSKMEHPGEFNWSRVGWFSFGVAVAIGPWLLRNLLWTGNPVYPLAGSIFGGVDWNPARNAQWAAAHSPDDRNILGWFVSVKGRPAWLIDITAVNDWLSPLLYGLGVLSLWHLWPRKTAAEADADQPRRMLKLFLMFWVTLFLFWWMFTHRLDRFWVPLLPVVATLAGIGAVWSKQKLWQVFLVNVLAITWVFNLCFVTRNNIGFNAYAYELKEVRKLVTPPAIQAINQSLQSGQLSAKTKVLLVGEAQPFDARFPTLYNTVFDDNLIRDFVHGSAAKKSSATQPELQPDKILRRLRAAGVTHVLVNWSQILRYRMPGSYGYDDFVHPELFNQLVQAGVLHSPQVLGQKALSETELKVVTASGWTEQLVTYGQVTKTTTGPIMTGDVFYTVTPPTSAKEPSR